MKALFFNDRILVNFNDSEDIWYSYSGFEFGEQEIYRKNFSKRIGELVDILKKKDYVKVKKMRLAI